MKTLALSRILTGLLALVASANSQTLTNPAITVRAETLLPDAVATGLMPVPIFNFAIHNVAFSPDGQILATGNGKGLVRLWDATTGKLRRTIPAHTNWAFSVAWSGDGKFFATGGGDHMVHLFNAADPSKPLKTFAGHHGDAHAVVMTPDGRQIVSAGDDKQIIVWSIDSDKPERTWLAHAKQIPALALSPDGTILASGSRDDSIRLWTLHTGELRDTLIGHSADVMSVRFSPDGKTLASAAYDHTVRLWDVASGKALRIFKGHTNRVFSVAFSPDGKRLASAGDSTVRIWDPQNGATLRVISLGGVIVTAQGSVTENLSSVMFSPDGKLLAVSSTTGLAFLLSSDTGAVVWRLGEPNAEQKPGN